MRHLHGGGGQGQQGVVHPAATGGASTRCRGWGKGEGGEGGGICPTFWLLLLWSVGALGRGKEGKEHESPVEPGAAGALH